MAAAVATQLRELPLFVTTKTSSGATYIVTGANTGLGFEAAKHLVALGAAKVIMGVRNISAGEKAKANIEAATGTTGIAEVWALDLASFDSVKAFAKKAIVELDRIDGLIENAGVAISQRTMSEGHLTSVTVNILSTFLLGVLLLPKLSDSAKQFGTLPHIAIVASSTGFDAGEDWANIKDDPLVKMDDEEMNIIKTYPLTKLLEIVAVRQLAILAPVSRTGVVVNVLCPGLCVTDLARNAPAPFREKIKSMHASYGRTAEVGSRTLLHGVIAGKESHGHFLDSCRIADDILPSWITDEEAVKSQKHTWDVIAKELESIEPGCVKKIM